MDIESVRSELKRLSQLLAKDNDLTEYLSAITHFAILEVPDCVGISITVVEDGTPYTILITDPELASIDAAQYLEDDGPCLKAEDTGEAIEVPDVLDEGRWQLFAQTAAATGIRSSLSLPLLYDGETIGAMNLYGRTPTAFDDRAHLLAEMVSGHAALAMHNADLSLLTRPLAEETDRMLAGGPALDRAATLVAHRRGMDQAAARALLQRSAAMAGIDPNSFAEALLQAGDR